MYPLDKKEGERVKWHCICDCGNECDILSNALVSGKTKSCGCLKHKQNPIADLEGQRFGKLIAIKPTSQRTNSGEVIWECECDCGNTHYVSRPNLLNGYVNSCGCLTISKGELKIKQILQDLKISFEQQKTFSSCIFPDSKRKAYFDFFLPEYKIIIEYDGEQHYIAKDFFGGEEVFQKQKNKDNFKDKWAEENGFILLRFRYTEYDNLNKEYLLERIKNNE